MRPESLANDQKPTMKEDALKYFSKHNTKMCFKEEKTKQYL